MKIKKPQLINLIEENQLYKVVQRQQQEELDITEILFFNVEEQDNQYSKIEFKCCHFKDCKCMGSKFNHSFFTDVIFENCDLSNVDFSETNFVRVWFINCKLVGCNFSNSSIYQSSMQECNAKYSNFSMATIKEMMFSKTNLESSSYIKLDKKDIVFEECNLVLAQLFDTNWNQVDFTTDDISGIIIGIKDLKGAIVTQYQAVELAKLIGIIIK